jgi:pseudaminic acid synthase
MNLKTMPDLAEQFRVVAGLSDHTLGITVPIAAVTLGACIIEKHFTLTRNNPGPDSAFSMEPKEFKEMVDAIRTAEKALGQVQYGITTEEAKSRVFRRSLFIVKHMKKGDVFTEENLRSIRPGHGLPPKYYYTFLGRRVNRDVKKGTPLFWDMIN